MEIKKNPVIELLLFFRLFDHNQNQFDITYILVYIIIIRSDVMNKNKYLVEYILENIIFHQNYLLRYI